MAQPAARPYVDGLRHRGVDYVDAASLAAALGDVVTHGDGILTWRGSEGVATFFAGSADALLQRPGDAGADDWALSAPVIGASSPVAPPSTGGASASAPAFGWALPLDALQLLGVAFEMTPSGLLLHLPDGRDLPVVAVAEAPEASAEETGALASEDIGAGWEMTEIAGVPALRFFAEPDKSLLLLDLDLAPLAFPETTAAVDEAVASAGNDHALLLVVTALSAQAWNSSLVFAQDGRSIEVRHPYRLRVYQGEPDSVGPGASVAAVVLLPPSYSLYRPLAVTWEAIDATVTFRR